MWPKSYQDRLSSWAELRDQCEDLDIEKSLERINQWWFRVPWRPYYLHWDDAANWPDPWRLLADNVFCDLARALGIAYTIIMIEPEKILEVELVEVDSGNLVLINGGKYILNWDPQEILNISSVSFDIKRIINSEQLKKRLG